MGVLGGASCSSIQKAAVTKIESQGRIFLVMGGGVS